MDINIDMFEKHEYNTTVENVFIRFLINNKYKLSPASLLTLPHTHLYHELFVCTSNEITIQTNLGIIRLSKGDAAIIPANMSHYKCDAHILDGWHSVGFFITKKSGTGYSDLYKKLKPVSSAKKPIVFRDMPDICDRIDRLHKALYKEDDYLPAIELSCILTRLAVIKTKNNTADNNPQARMPDIYRMSWFEDLIANCYPEQLNTSKVAQMLHISSRHLSRIIREHYGKTLHEILVKKRLDAATELLTTTDNSVNHIIKQIGYTKSSLFYKDFSLQFGVTPTEYRNKFKPKQ